MQAGQGRALPLQYGGLFKKIPKYQARELLLDRDGRRITLARANLVEYPTVGVGWIDTAFQQHRRRVRHNRDIKLIERTIQTFAPRFDVSFFPRPTIEEAARAQFRWHIAKLCDFGGRKEVTGNFFGNEI